MKWTPLWLMVLAFCLGNGPLQPEVDGVIDVPMFKRPRLESAEVYKAVPDGIRELWLQALNRPESDLREKAATAFGKLAAEHNLPVPDEVRQKLIELVENDPKLVVRKAAAETLIILDHQPAAEALFERNRSGDTEMRVLTDPALAEWGHQPAFEVWVERMNEQELAPALRRSAMAALATAGVEQAIDDMRRLAVNKRTNATVRLAAASALGDLAEEGLARSAQKLAEGDRVDQLVAVRLLGSHRGEGTIEVLRNLAGFGESGPIVRGALRRLRELDPMLVAERGSSWLDHNAPNVRLETVLALPARADKQAVTWLAERWNDPSPKVRRTARRLCRDLAEQNSELRQAVHEQIDATLRAEGWRRIEQAALLVGSLDYEPAAEPLVQLLRHPRDEVRLAVTEALRQIQVAATLPALFERAKEADTSERDMSPMGPMAPGEGPEQGPEAEAEEDEEAQEPAEPQGPPEPQSDELVQIFMAFGEQDYQETDEWLRQYIPKNGPGSPNTRAAAVWTLGLFYEGRKDEDLIDGFLGRLEELDDMIPEAQVVARMGAIGLGRMEAESVVEDLQQFREDFDATIIAPACKWAIERITGESQPPIESVQRIERGWFIEPLRQSDQPETGDESS